MRPVRRRERGPRHRDAVRRGMNARAARAPDRKAKIVAQESALSAWGAVLCTPLDEHTIWHSEMELKGPAGVRRTTRSAFPDPRHVIQGRLQKIKFQKK